MKTIDEARLETDPQYRYEYLAEFIGFGSYVVILGTLLSRSAASGLSNQIAIGREGIAPPFEKCAHELKARNSRNIVRQVDDVVERWA